MCLFCKMKNGEIPCFKIYEDAFFFAILDISPVAEGHTLLISKTHYDNFLEMPNTVLEKLSTSAQKVLLILKEKLHFEGANIINNIGKISGQSVMHCHFHLIPRYNENELIFNCTSSREPHDLEEIKKTYNKLI